MFEFLFSKNEKEVLAVVYDIGSASVGGALVFCRLGEKPRIVYSTRKEMPFQEKLNATRLKSEMFKAVDEVSQDIEKNGLRHLTFTKFGTRIPKKSFVSFSSPWFASQTRTILIKKDNSFTVTKKIIDEITEKEIESFKNSKEIAEHIGSGELAVMEKRIISIKLNGYQTDEPYGKKASSVEASIRISILQKQILENVFKNIQKTFNIDDIEIASFPFVAFDTIRSLKQEENFLFVDVSGEITDISLVHVGVIFDTSSFPIGKKTIIRRLSKELKTNKEDTLSRLRIYKNDETASLKGNRFETGIKRVGGEWISIFTKTIENISRDFSIPQNIYITADKDLEDLFARLISEEEFGQYTMSSQNFNINKINAVLLRDLYNGGGSMAKDPFLLMEAIFLNKSLMV